MKYMGHKGRIIEPIIEAVGSVLSKSSRIADPFCGSGTVSWHLANTFPNSVWAGDLQGFAVARAAAVVARKGRPSDVALNNWIQRADEAAESNSGRLNGAAVDLPAKWSAARARHIVGEHRHTAEGFRSTSSRALLPVITRAYGGHYFSLRQAIIFDALRSNLPVNRDAKRLALSALVGAASKCSASPGHTAQPFQPTEGASRWLLDAWRRAPQTYLVDEWHAALAFEAKAPGKALVCNAQKLTNLMEPGDVVFLDPPYSGVHYSRFYHVLETLVRGEDVSVDGRGRYPPPEQRPASSFSRKSEAVVALEGLLDVCADRKLRVILTFPIDTQSNGLSASSIKLALRRRFSKVSSTEACSTFSTLGGKAGGRAARLAQKEAIIVAYS